MYVDKTLAGIKAVQTLSRLNRARPNKTDTFVLDFMNRSEVIREAFADYYRTSILAEETDPNQLHDLKAQLDNAQVYTPQQVAELVERYLSGKDRGELTPSPTPASRPTWLSARMNRSRSKAPRKRLPGSTHSCRRRCPTQTRSGKNSPSCSTSSSRSCRRPQTRTCRRESSRPSTWTVTGLRSKPRKGCPSTTRMPKIGPAPTGDGGGGRTEPELEPLSRIIAACNETWGTEFTDADKVAELIRTLPDQVVADTAYRNARHNSDAQNARIEHDAALRRLITSMVRTNTELFRAYTEKPGFRSWLNDQIFWLTYLDDATQ